MTLLSPESMCKKATRFTNPFYDSVKFTITTTTNIFHWVPLILFLNQ